MKEDDILRAIALRNRTQFQSSISTDDEEIMSTLLGYDPSSGLMIMGDTQGKTEFADSITNGAIALNQSVRRRDGKIPKIDSMPFKKPIASTPIIQPSFKIIVGALVNYFGTTNPYYEDGSYFLGTLVNSAAVFKSSIAGNVAVSFKYGDTQLLYWTYDSMGYIDNTLTRLTFSAEFIDGSVASEDIANIICFIYSLTINQKAIASSTSQVAQVNLSTTTPINTALGAFTQIPDYYLACFQLGIKYQRSSDSAVIYTVTSGVVPEDSSRYKGVIIWNLGSLNAIANKDNPNCYFGFKWVISGITGVFFVGGYGTVDGIVLHLIGGNSQSFDVFVSYTLLESLTVKEVLPSDLMFSKPVSITISENQQSVTVGTMPTAIEKRAIAYPQVNGIQSNQALVLYSIYDTDKGKQIFGS